MRGVGIMRWERGREGEEDKGQGWRQEKDEEEEEIDDEEKKGRRLLFKLILAQTNVGRVDGGGER